MRVVLDTNVALDLFVFFDRGVTAISRALDEGRALLVTDVACREEFERVLGYPQLHLDGPAMRRALERYDRLARFANGEPARSDPAVPLCSDPDDQKFLDLAFRSRAELLVTKDRAVLRLARKTRGRIAILGPVEAGLLLRPPGHSGEAKGGKSGARGDA
jgi:putative PIN family toxin of toxin-antitoxin system